MALPPATLVEPAPHYVASVVHSVAFARRSDRRRLFRRDTRRTLEPGRKTTRGSHDSMPDAALRRDASPGRRLAQRGRSAFAARSARRLRVLPEMPRADRLAAPSDVYSPPATERK
jgi:hypothetical protein